MADSLAGQVVEAPEQAMGGDAMVVQATFPIDPVIVRFTGLPRVPILPANQSNWETR
jgi:hypothetical protein